MGGHLWVHFEGGGAPAPADYKRRILDISDTAWTANFLDEDNGIVILGVPLGQPAFVKAHGRKRMQKEYALLK